MPSVACPSSCTTAAMLRAIVPYSTCPALMWPTSWPITKNSSSSVSMSISPEVSVMNGLV